MMANIDLLTYLLTSVSKYHSTYPILLSLNVFTDICTNDARNLNNGKQKCQIQILAIGVADAQLS